MQVNEEEKKEKPSIAAFNRQLQTLCARLIFGGIAIDLTLETLLIASTNVEA